MPTPTENGAAAPETPDLDQTSVEAILSFDPFADGSDGDKSPKEEPTAATGAAPEETPSTEQPAAAPVEGTAPVDEPGKVDTDKAGSDETALLRELLKQKDEMINQLKTTKPEETKAGAEAHGPKVPDYAFTIPDELLSLMSSEDPAEQRKGVAALAQGVAQNIHATVMQEVQGIVTGFVPKLIQAQIQTRDQSQRVFEDFYNTHKELNNPDIYPIVVQVAQRMASQKGESFSWNAQFRDELAGAVKKLLNIQASAPAPTVALAKPPHIAGATTRPAPAQLDPVQKEIFDTLF